MDAPCERLYSEFPALEPHRTGYFQADELHSLYWEESGNPEGVPALYLHGGPGEGSPPSVRQLFDPDHYRIITFDQRGSLRSTPLAELRENTTQHLVADIEALREMFNVDRWLVTGGSWGTTLALAYGQAHPERCLGFMLRGVFLGTCDEIEWFVYGMRRFFPRAYEDFAEWIPESERQDLLAAYVRRVTSEDSELRMDAAKRWVKYSSSCSLLRHDPESVEAQADDEQTTLGMGTLDPYYFQHGMFLEDNQILNNLEKITHLPCAIIQGGHDMIATPNSAYQLHKEWPGSVLHMVANAGHSSSERGTMSRLIQATEQFKRDGRFG